MTTDCFDSETCTGEFILFSIIFCIVYLVACIQLVFCVSFVVLILAIAILVRSHVHSEVQNSAVGFLDHFTGLSVGSQITGEFDVRLFFVVLLFLLLASGPLYGSVLLFLGLKRNKVVNIIIYIISGTMVLGVRVWYIDSYEYRNFPEDLTVLYCGLYGIFLVMLVYVCVMLRKQKIEEIRPGA